MHEATNPIGSVQKSVKMIKTLKAWDGATATELTNHLDISKGAVHNHLATLEAEDFVVKYGSEYYPSLKFFEIGEYIRNKKQIYHVAKPEVDQIADETGELASLMVEEHGLGIYLYRSRGNNALTLDTNTGAQVYLHNRALGKSILAFLPSERRENIIDNHGLPQSGPNTKTQRDDLYDEFETIQEIGYALDLEERAKGVRCIAAPVLANGNEVKGAISIAGAKRRMDKKKLQSEYADLVKNAANVIGVNLTYQ